MDQLTRRVALPNGVRLLVRELRTAPVVTLNLWVGTGAADDPPARAGMAHFIEHVLFGGRGAGGPGGALVREVLDAGGHLNGETGCDGTTFYQILPTEAWQRVLERQVLALTGASFDRDEVDAERAVIVEEARGSERVPQSFLWHRLMERAFPDHPCGRPVVGTEESLADIRPEDLESHFMSHYRGGNLVEVICGDVDADEVVDRASGLLGNLPGGDRPPRADHGLTSERGVEAHGYEGDLERAYVYVAHRAPHALHDDLPALDVLTGLLGVGRSARLRRRLQLERSLVSSVSSGVVTYRDIGLHVVRAVTSAGSVEEVVGECLDEFGRLAGEGINDREMEKSVRRLESAYALEHETSDSIARTLGHYEMLGDYELAEKYVDRLAAVSAADVRRAAETWLADGTCTVVSYAPRGSGAPVGAWRPRRARTSGRRARIMEERPKGPPPAPFERPALVAESSAPYCTREELVNGAVLVKCVSRSVPVASVAVSFRGGHSEEPEGYGGITYATQKALLRGTTRYSAARLAEEVETIGGGIGTAVDRDGFGIGLTVLSSRLERATELLSEVVTSPAFEPEQVAHAREEVTAEIGAAQDDPMSRALLASLPLVLSDHPYGRPVRGTIEEVSRITSDDVASWHAERYGASRMVICGAGDVPDGGLDRLAAPAADAQPPRAVPDPTARPEGDIVLESSGVGQSTVVVAFLGPPAGTDASLALRVAARGLGMMGGVLWRELREKPPHAYSVGASVFQFARAGIVVGYATSQPGGEEGVRDALLETFEGLAGGGLDDDDLGRAARSTAGSYEIALQRGSARAAACSMAEIVGTGYERVFRTPELLRSVTRDDVVAAAAGHLVRERGAASVIVRGA